MGYRSTLRHASRHRPQSSLGLGGADLQRCRSIAQPHQSVLDAAIAGHIGIKSARLDRLYVYTIYDSCAGCIVPALDVPNAFTPGSGGINSVILVRGFGVAKMRFIIWNRWGQKVFETGNINQGWDGKVKGVLQPMDVYAYTLDVEFFDNTKASKKGDITLIR